MSIDEPGCLPRGRPLEALRHKLKRRCDLLPRHVELFHDFFDAQIFKILDDCGNRVSLKTHAPLNRPGTLSTAEHCDQSRLAIVGLLFPRIAPDLPGNTHGGLRPNQDPSREHDRRIYS